MALDAAFRCLGDAMEIPTAPIVKMSQHPAVNPSFTRANLHISNVRTTNVFQDVGGVIMITTVAMVRMRLAVYQEIVQNRNSDVAMDVALEEVRNVMVNFNVKIDQTKQIVMPLARRMNFSVQIHKFAFSWNGNAMEMQIVLMDLTRRIVAILVLIMILNVKMDFALMKNGDVTDKMIVKMVLMNKIVL